jgi:hypothetical protein
MEKIPTEKIPIEKMPTEKMPIENVPIEKTPAEKKPAAKTPAMKFPADKYPTAYSPAVITGTPAMECIPTSTRMPAMTNRIIAKTGKIHQCREIIIFIAHLQQAQTHPLLSHLKIYSLFEGTFLEHHENNKRHQGFLRSTKYLIGMDLKNIIN